MKIVCFIGSGFNYMLADIVKSQNQYTKNDSSLHEELVRLNNLWYQFEPLLSPFNNYIPTKYGEELLEAVEGFQSLCNQFIGRVDDTLFNTETLFAARIKREMQKIGMQFTKFEKEGGYSLINRSLPNFGRSFNDLLSKNGISNLYLCSTNYDGITDSLLTYYCDKEHKRKFILKDGFINRRFNPGFFINSNYKLAHIHGSYRYYEGDNNTLKLDREIINNNPVMIFDNPIRKEEAILKNCVLATTYRELERQLSTCDKVISIGNSFKTEPHLKRLFRTYFNRPETQLIVCSDRPDDVVSTLTPYYDYTIYTQSTKHVQSEEQLIRLFSQLFDFKDLNMHATA